MAETVPAAEFARNFGRYKMQAQREAVPVSSNGTLAGYFVSPHEYEEAQKIKSMRRRFRTAELPDEEAERIASSRMDSRHDHLNKILDLGGLAEFERGLIRARTGEGRERAKARGQRMGRPPRLTPHQRTEARKALAEGAASQADLARRFAVSQSTISRLADKVAAAPAPVRRALDAATERAAKAFLAKLEGKVPVIEGILYGSRARGDFAPDSDADIAVILKGRRGDRAAASLEMAGVAFDVMMETGVMVQGLPLWAEELKRPERFSNPALIESILREGVRL